MRITIPPAIELPNALLRAIRVAVKAKGREASDVKERIAGVRAKVPVTHRAEFDELAGEPPPRVSSPSEFDGIVKGDVLATELTTEAFNIFLPLLGGIVTDSGGLPSHSAIVAREYGIPGVVGTREATVQIIDRAPVRVDGHRRRSHGARMNWVVPLEKAGPRHAKRCISIIACIGSFP